MNTRKGWLPSHGFSLQHKLPLLICVLLLGIIITFSWISYIGVRNAALDSGKTRLTTLGTQLSTMFSQSAYSLLGVTQAAANQESIRRYLEGEVKFKDKALQALEKLQLDSSWVLTELTGVDGQPLIRSGRDSTQLHTDYDSFLGKLILSDSAFIGRLYLLKDSMYYPVVAPVIANQRVIGHLVRWRWQTSTPAALEQISHLLGSNGRLYVGNADGSLWTDMMQVVSYPNTDNRRMGEVLEYADHDGNKVIAVKLPIGNVPWVLSIDFPRQLILESASRFLRWIILVGGILLIIGIFIGWQMSRSITKPLNRLMTAASVIADGDYSSRVIVDRNDELGQLATVFNTMAVQVSSEREDLEKKVTERTAQLEMVNKELESFSYSISHDLRAPLRAIVGFASILKEDYGSKLDDEGKRITTVIKDNTLKMGTLIDDLLSFSSKARKDLVKSDINPTEIVKGVIKELVQENTADNVEWILHPLPNVKADASIIRQVWVNLISNAVKYSSNSKPARIEIGSFPHEGQTAFFVKDNGVGFDEKYKDKLFKVFQRLHGDTAFKGSGIGLAIVEKIISKHGGNVWAEGVPGKGASFYFSLPSDPNN